MRQYQYTLVVVYLQAMLLQAGENLPEVIQVLDCIVTGHQHVIKVFKTEREAAQNLINESLENLRKHSSDQKASEQTQEDRKVWRS